MLQLQLFRGRSPLLVPDGDLFLTILTNLTICHFAHTIVPLSFSMPHPLVYPLQLFLFDFSMYNPRFFLVFLLLLSSPSCVIWWCQVSFPFGKYASVSILMCLSILYFLGILVLCWFSVFVFCFCFLYLCNWIV